MIPLYQCPECYSLYRIGQLYPTPLCANKCCPRCRRYLVRSDGLVWDDEVIIVWLRITP